MIILEIIAVIFTILCVALTIKQHILCWPIGIIGVVSYGFVFLHEKLYAEMILQCIFIIQMIYGWVTWKKTNEYSTKEIDWVSLFMVLVFSFLFIILLSMVLLGVFNSSQPLLDSATSVLSLLANYFMAKKIIQGWHLWIFIDLLMIIMFLNQELYLSSLLYSGLLILAFLGLSSWKKNLKTA